MNPQIAFYENKLAYEMDPADLFEALSKNEKIVVVDTRKADGFKNEHIPGAINFPHRTMNADSTRSLDKNALYVTYCDGIGCNASTKGALNLSKFGFKVKELIGGIEWWKSDGYATEGVAASGTGQKVECYC
jgi:rhodanese-related sulfurtransferase